MNNPRDKPLFAVYCGMCCCLVLPLTIAMMVMMYFAYKNEKGYSNGVTNIGSNWYKDMIFAVTNNPHLPLSPGQYLDQWKGRYPGNDEGCLCDSRYMSGIFYFSVRQGMKHRSCNWTESSAGCQDIPELSARDLTKWTEGQEIFVVREYGTSFSSIYDKMKEDGTCVEGYRHCGDINSISKGICISTQIKECPLTDISQVPKPGYVRIPFQGFDLYTSRDQSMNSLVDADISEDHLCFSRGDMSTTPGRDKYELLDVDYSVCEKDNSAISLGDIGEADFFDLNGLDYRRLLRYYVSNSFKYKMFTGRYIEWSPSCKNQMEEIGSQRQRNERLTSTFKVHFIFMWISSIPSILLLFRIFQYTSSPSEYKVYIAIFAVRVFFFLILLPTSIICYFGTLKMKSFLNLISSQDCSTQESNYMISRLSENYNRKVVTYFSLFFWFYISTFILESIMLIIRVQCRKSIVDGNNMDPHNPVELDRFPQYQPLNEYRQPDIQQAPPNLFQGNNIQPLPNVGNVQVELQRNTNTQLPMNPSQNYPNPPGVAAVPNIPPPAQNVPRSSAKDV